MRIYISMEIDDEYADETSELGVTEGGFDDIMDALMHLGQDIVIRANPESSRLREAR